MKKIIFLLVIVLALSSISFARIGDVTGSIYSTDIKAFINKVEVKSYNIGGRTCIPIEEVTTLFTYNNDLRALNIESFASFMPKYLIEYKSEASTLPIGTVAGKTYETDIKTYVCGNEMTSYNIGGMTAICMEDLLDLAVSNISGSWDAVNRIIEINSEYVSDGQKISMSERRDLIDDFLDSRMATINERIDTDDYSFLYLTQPTPHGNNDMLVYFDAYGEYRSLGGELDLTNGNFGNYGYTLKISDLKIDKELGAVTFTANTSHRFSFNLLTGVLVSL